MDTDRSPNLFKWFSKTNLKLSFKRLRSDSALFNSFSRRLNHVPSLKSSSPEKVTISRPLDDELKQVFSHFDTDGDGKVSGVELRAYFGSMGEYMSSEEAQTVIEEVDMDGDGLLDFNDFLKLMKKGGGRGGGAAVDEEEEEEDLKKAFEMFEMKKGDGCITPRGLQKMLGRLGDGKSLEECAAMIQVFDTDGDGVLDFHEFHRMMA